MLKLRPANPLNCYIKSIWYSSGRDGIRSAERVLPTGSVDVLISLSDRPLQMAYRKYPDQPQKFEDAVFCGPYTEYYVLAGRLCSGAVMGIHFKPGGAAAFFDTPIDEAANMHLPLSELWGQEADKLREELIGLGSPSQRIQYLQQYLLALLYKRTTSSTSVSVVEYALQQLAHAEQSVKIKKLVDKSGYSHRVFNQRFRQQVGMTAKAYQRICRFQSLIGQVEETRQIDWSYLSSCNGYFDQSHLIHDMEAFTGLSPKAYLAHRGGRLNHLRLLV